MASVPAWLASIIVLAGLTAGVIKYLGWSVVHAWVVANLDLVGTLGVALGTIVTALSVYDIRRRESRPNFELIEGPPYTWTVNSAPRTGAPAVGPVTKTVKTFQIKNVGPGLACRVTVERLVHLSYPVDMGVGRDYWDSLDMVKFKFVAKDETKEVLNPRLANDVLDEEGQICDWLRVSFLIKSHDADGIAYTDNSLYVTDPWSLGRIDFEPNMSFRQRASAAVNRFSVRLRGMGLTRGRLRPPAS